MEQNRSLKNRHVGRRCFILATGPSIKTQDLEPLADEICISVSNFFVHPQYNLIRPAYHCFVGYHPPIPEEAFQTWLGEMAGGTGNAEIFVPVVDHDRMRASSLFSNRIVRYLGWGGTFDDYGTRPLDLTRPIPHPQSVSIMALMVSLYLGCSEIFLMGCDHDWILHVRESRHFYDEKRHALVRAGYTEWIRSADEPRSDMERQLECNLNLWRHYRHIRGIAAAIGTKIYYATPGGLLDLFPRAALKDLGLGLQQPLSNESSMAPLTIENRIL